MTSFVATDPTLWSADDVGAWFESIGCGEYKPLVEKEDLDGQLLFLLGDTELHDFGILNSFHRKKILKKKDELAGLKESNNAEPIPSSRPEREVDLDEGTRIAVAVGADTMEEKELMHGAVGRSGPKDILSRTWNAWPLQSTKTIAWSNTRSLIAKPGNNLQEFVDSKWPSDSALMKYSKNHEHEENQKYIQCLEYDTICPARPYFLPKGETRSLIICNIDNMVEESHLRDFLENHKEYPTYYYKSHRPKSSVVVVTYCDIGHSDIIYENVRGKCLQWSAIEKKLCTRKRGAYEHGMFVFPCIPTHAVYQMWNSGAIVVRTETFGECAQSTRHGITKTFSAYGTLLRPPVQIDVGGDDLSRVFLVTFKDCLAAERAVTGCIDRKYAYRKYARPSSHSRKVMFSFCQVIDSLTMANTVDWAAKAEQHIQNALSLPTQNRFLTSFQGGNPDLKEQDRSLSSQNVRVDAASTFGTDLEFTQAFDRLGRYCYNKGRAAAYMPSERPAGHSLVRSRTSVGNKKPRHHQNAGERRKPAITKHPAAPSENSHRKNIIRPDDIRRGKDRRTTLCIKNIPNRLTKADLLMFLDEQFKCKYDFFYLPIDFTSDYNVGYFFLNAINTCTVLDIFLCFHGKMWKDLMSTTKSSKLIEICYATKQGRATMIRRQQNSSLFAMDEKYQPVIFYTEGPCAGQVEPFPHTFS